ncbi:MAG: hypothetical protein Q4G05_03135 [Clostridia bacterium]|nr:hypothetical protein [Clostridia bacterium]
MSIKTEISSIQEWLPYQSICNNGIIKLKNSTYIKIIKVIPINFNLKSELEKQSILNSYKIFLKTCGFNIQILIQSKKEDLSKQVSKVKENQKKESEELKIISENYINYIKELNERNNSSSKNFYILIKKDVLINSVEKVVIDELNDNYLKIKECLSRCGNVVTDINQKKEVEKIIRSFF